MPTTDEDGKRTFEPEGSGPAAGREVAAALSADPTIEDVNCWNKQLRGVRPARAACAL
eukprot:gene38415-27544_t